jgi:hypothetical protein
MQPTVDNRLFCYHQKTEGSLAHCSGESPDGEEEGKARPQIRERSFQEGCLGWSTIGSEGKAAFAFGLILDQCQFCVRFHRCYCRQIALFGYILKHYCLWSTDD